MSVKSGSERSVSSSPGASPAHFLITDGTEGLCEGAHRLSARLPSSGAHRFHCPSSHTTTARRPCICGTTLSAASVATPSSTASASTTAAAAAAGAVAGSEAGAAAASPEAVMESPNDRNDRALRVATGWYSSHLPADSPPVVLVTHIPLSSLFFPRDQTRIPGPGRLQRRPEDITIHLGWFKRDTTSGGRFACAALVRVPWALA